MGEEISKLGNAKILSSNPQVAPHIPEAHRLNKSNLQQMLQKYSTVYVKPNNSCQGKGIIRIDRKNDFYLLKTRDKKTTFQYKTIDRVMARIYKEKMNRIYIVQRGIASYTVNNRLYDIRPHLLRIDGEWQIGAIIGRVANQHGVATNAYSGGTPVKIHALLAEHLKLEEQQQEAIIQEITNLSLEATNTFSKAFPKWTEFGLDIGIDSEEHLWIYEINIKPGMLVFRKDRDSYKRIMEMKKRRG